MQTFFYVCTKLCFDDPACSSIIEDWSSSIAFLFLLFDLDIGASIVSSCKRLAFLQIRATGSSCRFFWLATLGNTPSGLKIKYPTGG